MQSFLKELLQRLKKNEYKVSVEKTEHPRAYYKITRNLKENLFMFEEAIKAIKTKYEPYSFEYVFQEEFGEELSPEDFQYQERIEAYCERNRVSPERLHELKREKLKLREVVNNKIFAEVTLAQGNLLLRDGNCPDFMLTKVVRLEEKYGDLDKATEYKKMLDKVKAEKIKIKEGARWEVLNYASKAIVLNINPYGKEPAFQEDWKKAIDLIEKKLRAQGITIDEYGCNKETWEALTEVNKQMKQEEKDKRITLGQFCERAQVSEKTEDILQKEVLSKDISASRGRNI